MQSKVRVTLLWLVLIVLFVVAWNLSGRGPDHHEPYEVFTAHVEGGEVQAVRVDSNQILVSLWSGYEYQTLGVVDEDLTMKLSEQGVMIAWGPEPKPVRKLLTLLLPLVLFLALLVYFVKKGQGGTANILSLRKSTARKIDGDDRASFEDVGGCEEAKDQLADVIDFLKHPDRWTESGVRLPRGVLLEGPPGCGKTLLARAVAGETEATFFLVSASEFVEMFVGIGAARVRDTFEKAAKQAPAVIFIDELDAVGRKRGSGIGAGHDEREQTLNQILVCMDGFEHAERVVVIAATNRADVLDGALLRAGRFDRRIEIGMLDRDQRRQVLEIHTRNKSLDEAVDLDALADRTSGLSGADIENLCNEAGLLAVRRLRKGEDEKATLRNEDFDKALEVRAPRHQRFDCVDSLLVESTTQLAQPTGRARVRLTLLEGSLVEGDLVWADACFLKVASEGDGDATVVSKAQIKSIESLDGTDAIDAAAMTPDTWASKMPDLA